MTLLVLAVSLSACVSVPNVEICIRLDEGFGGACGYTLDGPDRDMTEEQYREQEIGQIYMSASSYSEIKKFILKSCRKSNECNLEHTEGKLNSVEKKRMRIKK
jgi:hypothetical protein